MNESGVPFMLILSADGKLLGTLTDGDVRRAMLGGANLDDPVARCMHQTPLISRPGRMAEIAALLKQVPFLPLVDDDSRVVDLLLPETGIDGINVAVVMAGGKGRRLGSRTRHRPKPLLPIGDRPMIDRVLARLEAAQVPLVYVSVHHMSEQIESYLSTRKNACEIRVIREAKPLGTAGGLGQIPSSCTEDVLVINADLVTNVDLLSLARFHYDHRHDGTIAVARYEVEVPFGVVRHDEAGRFVRIDEKPRMNFFVAGGIYLLAPAVRALVPPQTSMDMPNLLTIAHQAGLSIGLFPIHEYWLDVGRPDDLKLARQRARRLVGGDDSAQDAGIANSHD